MPVAAGAAVLAVLALFVPARGQETRPANLTLGLRLSHAAIADDVFEEVYGKGGTMLGGEATWLIHSAPGFALGAGLEFRRLALDGLSTVTRTPARMVLTPAGLDLQVHFGGRVVMLYLGCGPDLVSYNETSDLQSTSGSTLGLHVGGGVLLTVAGLDAVKIKAFARWSTARAAVRDLEVQLGGTEYGISLLAAFRI